MQITLGEGTFPLAEVAGTLKQVGWKGWVLNEEERLDGSKHGAAYMRPAFKAMQGAFSA
jgi:sugar phosphate isomerase/epimerase